MSIAYCPLFNISIDNDVLNDFNEFIINTNLKILTKDYKLTSSKLVQSNLSFKEQEELPYYWLYVKANCDFYTITNYIHLFQLSLLIVKSTTLKIFYKFNTEDLNRFEDIFKFIDEKEYNVNIELDDTVLIKKYYPIILEIFNENNRLRSALVSMLNGCTAIHWSASYVLFITTFETILTHKSNWGIKKKLAWAYSILTEKDNQQREIAFREFLKIYKVRSEILHGESFKDKYNDGKLNLKELAKCRDMLRKLWQIILNSEELIDVLSGKDNVRKEYFKKISEGWMPKDLSSPLEGEKTRIISSQRGSE
ncbi:MAG: hypothetical protein K9N09_03060 [Candidatus Cloacimonetes bacterium]|nr:hypothetical protein [Candidatus Cloacimonadota bacterium]MCF7814815.1 hypothetical protein [Candidatus Cloacimonadota bacterium]MCF7867655.1 hypothetical protein [Candidatus Cloacimonadota bacterium]MCF7883547.1 hypothetical protein [Candidatus Cloacimonadota bacterium]